MLTSNFNDLCSSGGEHGRSGPKPPYGASSGWWVILSWRLGFCMSSLAHSLPGGTQARGMGRRPIQAWVSCFEGRTTACDPDVSVVSSVAPTFSTASSFDSASCVRISSVASTVTWGHLRWTSPTSFTTLMCGFGGTEVSVRLDFFYMRSEEGRKRSDGVVPFCGLCRGCV